MEAERVRRLRERMGSPPSGCRRAKQRFGWHVWLPLCFRFGRSWLDSIQPWPRNSTMLCTGTCVLLLVGCLFRLKL
jgi:hypothetical protein